MTKIIEIHNIQEFISEIEKYEDTYYFRGESSIKYNQIKASAFREYPTPFSSDKNKTINYQKALKEYYIEIGHELTEIERENFLFYAQHHGLPTPLIDITASPLTVLFFACSSNFGEQECVVHGFDKSRFISISESDDIKEMTLNEFFFDNDFTYKILMGISKLSKEKKAGLFVDCVERLKNIFVENSFSSEKYIGIEIQATMKKILSNHNLDCDEKNIYVESFVELFKEYFDVDFKFDRKESQFATSISLKDKEWFFRVHYDSYFTDIQAVIIIFLINQQTSNMILKFLDNANKVKFSDGEYGVIFPLVLMHPTVKFERMKSQEGSFLYQTPHFNGVTDNYIGFASIDSDVKYIIKNKEKIMMSLDRLGISRKTIFPDHDNIAEYLKYKQLIKL